MKINDAWLLANNFDRSEHGGWERIAADGSWIRWRDGDVFAGRPEKMNPTIDGPAQDKLVKRGVATGEALLRLVK